MRRSAINNNINNKYLKPNAFLIKNRHGSKAQQAGSKVAYFPVDEIFFPFENLTHHKKQAKSFLKYATSLTSNFIIKIEPSGG